MHFMVVTIVSCFQFSNIFWLSKNCFLEVIHHIKIFFSRCKITIIKVFFPQQKQTQQKTPDLSEYISAEILCFGKLFSARILFR